MSGLTALVDTLLATRLAQRVDLVPLKPEIEIAGPGAVTQVEEIANDVRLPSRAAMLHQLGVGLLTEGDNSHATAALARPGEHVTLSVAARAVTSILEVASGATAQVIGTEPLWPKAEAPHAPALSATLTRTVVNSGLFYESHLEQFAAGTRTLAQLAQEPQARLDASAKVALALPIADAAAQGSTISGTATAIAPALVAVAGSLTEAPVLPGAAPLSSATESAVLVDSGKSGGGAASLPNAVPVGLASSPESALLRQTGDLASLHKNAYESIQQAGRQEPTVKSHGISALDTSRSAPGLAGIHPDAVALVRQQLDLLTVPVFRWSGEAWPGTPMNWEIHEEQDQRQASIESEAVPRTWSTRVTLTLPMLKDVEMRISLAGTTLQVHLATSETITRDLLGEARAELPKRLAELGLQLTGLQIGLLPAASAAQAMPKYDDAQ